MEKVLAFFEKIASAVWGLPTILLLVAVGIFYTVKLRFFQFSHVKHTFRHFQNRRRQRQEKPKHPVSVSGNVNHARRNNRHG